MSHPSKFWLCVAVEEPLEPIASREKVYTNLEAAELLESQASRLTRLEAFILSLRSGSHYVGGDAWYACPKSGECLNEWDVEDGECNCGTDDLNEKIDKVLSNGQ